MSKASELRDIANGAIDEDKINNLVQGAFKSAMRAAQKGEFRSILVLNERHSDPNHRTSSSEQAEVIRRIEEEGFAVEHDHSGYWMHWR